MQWITNNMSSKVYSCSKIWLFTSKSFKSEFKVWMSHIIWMVPSNLAFRALPLISFCQNGIMFNTWYQVILYYFLIFISYECLKALNNKISRKNYMIYKIKLVYFRKKITIQKTQFTFVNDQTHVMKIIVIFGLLTA